VVFFFFFFLFFFLFLPDSRHVNVECLKNDKHLAKEGGLLLLPLPS
jgi:hypothetical protein